MSEACGVAGRAFSAASRDVGSSTRDEAVVACDDEGFARGRAAFETLRVYDGTPFRLAQHVERLARSAARLGLPAPGRRRRPGVAGLALAAAGSHDGEAVLRLYWTPGAPGRGAARVALVSAVPDWIEPARAIAASGSSRFTFPASRRRRGSCPARSPSATRPHRRRGEAKRRGADDAVLVDLDGTVLEGPVTNVWWREGDALVTPSLELGILAGETRAALLELATSVGYETEEGVHGLDRLLAAEEVFTSSSVREVMPVVRSRRQLLRESRGGGRPPAGAPPTRRGADGATRAVGGPGPAPGT